MKRSLAILALLVVAPLAALTSALWLSTVVMMAWERRPGFGKDIPVTLLVFALSLILIRWSVALARIARLNGRDDG